jgi:hypothetical protein
MGKMKLISVSEVVTTVLFFCLFCPGVTGADPGQPRSFKTPREVALAVVDAAERNDTGALLELFGESGRSIVESGDSAEDQRLRGEFVRRTREKLQMEEDRLLPKRVTFTVGAEDWPFPVPLIEVGGRWQLDPVAGRMEVLARRIGRNELNAMEVCRGYVEAQVEYARVAHDGEPLLQYAQRIVSSAGKYDGLYAGDVSSSLVAPSFAGAAVAGGVPGLKRPVAYHGYYYRLLKSQGPAAAGGALDYVVGGRMIGGFALVAWPAEYGVSGIRTLLINHEGVVYEKDLGTATALRASQVSRFNPDRSWRRISVE